MKSREESNKNIKTCINGIKLNDSNLDYHINCLISEIKECKTNKILELIDVVLTNARRKANEQIQDEQSMAHTHTAINQIDDDLKQRITEGERT